MLLQLLLNVNRNAALQRKGMGKLPCFSRQQQGNGIKDCWKAIGQR
jgi:hypothetical protein